MTAKKRETQEQKIRRVLKEELEYANKTEISHCNFTGVQFDAAAVNAVQTIATGLIENAKGLGKLAEVLKASNVNIETMMKIEGK